MASRAASVSCTPGQAPARLEVQYARGTDEDEALVWIEGVLAGVSYEQVAEAAHLE